MHDQPNEIPEGFCQCGCGARTGTNTHTGRPSRYRPGHNTRPADHRFRVNPTGLCGCGCDQPTNVYHGAYSRFLPGHRSRLQGRTGDGPNPSGLCLCGCERQTPLASQSSARNGNVIGKPTRYCVGHQARKSPVDYVERDCGYETPCWVWQLTLTKKGYGRKYLSGRRHMFAHRSTYEAEYGPVPEGLELDHLCRTRACVNPDHLEAVTHAENMRRAAEAWAGAIAA